LAYAMGGRVAEEVVFHDPSTGASNDITKATETARKMVTEYGMSARVGTVKLGSADDEPFLGREMASGRDFSDALAFVVDPEDGITARVGTVKRGSADDEPCLGREMASRRDVSDELAFVVDEEVRKLMDTAHGEAYWILTENRDILDNLAARLLEEETLNRHE